MPWRSASYAAATDDCFAVASAPADRTSTSRRLIMRKPPWLARASSAPLRHLGRLILVPPPDVGEQRRAVFRHRLRMREAVPPRRALERIAPLRHDIEIPQQHAVERLGRGDELLAALGKDHAVDPRNDRRDLDADEVARARLIGRLRAPAAALLVPWRQRLAPGSDDD